MIPWNKGLTIATDERVKRNVEKAKESLKTLHRKSIENYKAARLGGTDSTPKYYVYEYVHPITDTVFYVGKGQGKRCFTHLHETRRGKLPNDNNGKFFRAIKSILDNRQEPIINIVADTMTEIEALAYEAACIDYYGLESLCNYQHSGLGATNHTPESKSRISKNVKAAMCKPEIRRKVINAHAKRYFNDRYGNYFETLYQRYVKKESARIDRVIRELKKDVNNVVKKPHKETKPFTIRLYMCATCGHCVSYSKRSELIEQIKKNWACGCCSSVINKTKAPKSKARG